MSYPNKLKEYFAPDGGINTILVKNGKTTTPPPPPPENLCNGATDMVELQVSYRGSDWAEGIFSAIEVNGETWNINHWDNLLDKRYGVEFSVGGYDFFTTFEGGAGRATLNIKPHHNTDYVIVKIIPDSRDIEGNSLLGIIGGGLIKFDLMTMIGEFCMKPTLKEPISCVGAKDRITFNTQQAERMSLDVIDVSGEFKLTYNVTVDGIDYGVVNFHETTNPTFGNIGLQLVEESSFGSGWYSLILTGGVIGQGHRFNLQKVDSLGGNNIYEMALSMDGEDPTVDHNPQTREVEFCMAAMSRCDGASDNLRFEHSDYNVDDSPTRDQVFPLTYNVTANGIDYGQINFIDPTSSPEGNIRHFGDYAIQYTRGSWGSGTLTLIGGPIDIPVHLKLDPVDAIVSNINYPAFDRTVVYNVDTKAIEFCLVRGECSGATNKLRLFMSPNGGISESSFTEFYHSFEMKGEILNQYNGIDLVSQGYHQMLDGQVSVMFSPNSEDGTLTISADGNRIYGVHKVIIRPPNDGSNYVTGIDFTSNPTAVEHPDGSITFCIEVVQPS